MMDMRTSILVTLLPTVTINLTSILGERQWRQALRKYWPIPVFTIFGSFLGTRLLLTVDPDPFRLLLAAMLVVYLLAEYLHKSERPVDIPPWGMGLFGLTLGVLAGLTNVFAPAIVVFALFTKMDTTLMVAAFNLTFLFSKSGQILGYVFKNAFTLEALRLSAIAIVPVLLSLWFGIRIRKQVDQETYKRVLRLALWVIAFLLIIDGGRRMIH
jgi:hypothetical protein